MLRNHWLILLLSAAFLLFLACEGDDDDDNADDDDSATDDDDDSDDDDDDTGYDPEDLDGDGSKTTDDPPDCDDNDPTIYPGAYEIWDYLDNDCDGDRDEMMPLHRVGMLDGDSYDGLSIGLLAPGDITGDGLADVVIGTEARGVLLYEGSETRVDYGTETLTLPGWENPDPTASQDNPNGFGTVMASGDPDNDQDTEIFIAGHMMDGGASGSGVVYMFDTSDGDLYNVDAQFDGDMIDQNFGVGMVADFDVNTDGIDDLIIAARMPPSTWEIHLFFGSNGGFSGNYDAGDADAVITGEMDETDDDISFGQAPDLNGDGSPELMIGTPDDGEEHEGKAYMFMSRVQWGGVTFNSAEVNFSPDGAINENMGHAVGTVGNMVGGDGQDIFVTAPGYDGPGAGYGRVHIYGSDEHSWMGTMTGDQAESSVKAEIAQDFGAGVVGIGDIELDTHDDMVVLTMDHEQEDFGYGALYIVRGRQGGLPADHALGETTAHYLAEENDYLGPHLLLGGDIDGDGYVDLLIGDYLSGWGDGRVYVVYSPQSPLE